MARRKDANGNVVAVRGAPIDFLGYSFDHDKVLLRKRIKMAFARKAARIKSRKRRREVLASYWGWCKWGDCRNLWNKVTNKDMSFAEKGITGRNATNDGQKFFDVPIVRADDIINVPIKVTDFIPGVKTREGSGRYVVRIIHEGRECKFITNSFTLKSMLDQAAEKGILPMKEGFDTILRKRDLGCGKKDYKFD